MGSLRSIALRLKTGTEGLNYGREIVGAWGAEAVRASRLGPDVLSIAPIRVLDLGCGDGTDLRNVAAQLGPDDASPRLLELHGLENWKPNVEICHRNGIATHVADIERDELPFADGSFDLVIANQILEHTKEIFWIAAEVARVLRPGGRWIVGVPNLASLHNRLLLVCGQQPTAQQSASAHVRGFTRGDFTHFAEQGDFGRWRSALRHRQQYSGAHGVAKGHQQWRERQSRTWQQREKRGNVDHRERRRAHHGSADEQRGTPRGRGET